jgi:diaminohydroxyphosphoribosylaminopyrimidine deaminase/5-amino-6-(5-phosphoribosylamino)uracil reductase
MMALGSSDRSYMARALQLARRGLYTTDPNPRVGCVLVRDGEIVGEGWHERAGSAHAEVAALQVAGDRARGAVAFVSLEPCCHQGRTPPCTEALIRAGVRRVVAAMRDPNPQVAGAGLAQLRAAGIDVECGVLEFQARALNPGFVSRLTLGRPWIRSKMAMTLDGRTATAAGQSRWITNAAARQDVQRLRARSSAILTGIGTVLADDPSLTVRLAGEGALRAPTRVVLDSHLRIPPSARILDDAAPTVVYCVTDGPAAEVVSARGAVVHRVAASAAGRIELGTVMQHLAELRCNEVLVEAGPTLSGTLLAEGLVDELVVYMAPRLLGDGARGLFTLPGIGSLEAAVSLDIVEMRAIGDNWRITARVAQPN